MTNTGKGSLGGSESRDVTRFPHEHDRSTRRGVMCRTQGGYNGGGLRMIQVPCFPARPPSTRHSGPSKIVAEVVGVAI